MVIRTDLLSFARCQDEKYLSPFLSSSWHTISFDILFIGILLNHAWRLGLGNNENVNLGPENPSGSILNKAVRKFSSIFRFHMDGRHIVRRRRKETKIKFKTKVNWDVVRPGGKKSCRDHYLLYSVSHVSNFSPLRCPSLSSSQFRNWNQLVWAQTFPFFTLKIKPLIFSIGNWITPGMFKTALFGYELHTLPISTLLEGES